MKGKAKGRRPLYVIRIDEGYYAAEWPFKKVAPEDRLFHKDAERIRGKLKRIGYKTAVEEVK